MTKNEELWRALSLYESRDIVKRRFKERHERSINDGNARAISSSFVQGRQYFEGALLAGELVRPLLIYYGVLALTRGLILMLQASKTESSLKPSHGLSARNWQQILRTQEPLIGDLKSLTVRAERTGTFPELALATCNHERISSYWDDHKALFEKLTPRDPREHSFWYRMGTIRYPVGMVFTFEDIVRRLPDLSSLYFDTLEQPSACHFAKFTETSHFTPDEGVGAPTLRIQVSSSEKPIEFKRFAEQLNLTKQNVHKVTDLGNGTFRFHLEPVSGRSMISLLPWILTDMRGERYMVEALNGEFLSTLSLLYSAAFFTGMLARYHPATWQSLSSQRGGDAMLPLLRASVDVIESRFPREILELLERIVPPEIMTPKPFAEQSSSAE